MSVGGSAKLPGGNLPAPPPPQQRPVGEGGESVDACVNVPKAPFRTLSNSVGTTIGGRDVEKLLLNLGGGGQDRGPCTAQRWMAKRVEELSPRDGPTVQICQQETIGLAL